MSTKILLTGGRAPATLYLARLLYRQGYDVYVADSIPFYLAKYSNKIKKSFVLPSPHQKDEYIASLSDILKKYEIDILLPTCEEVFFIAQYQNKIPKTTEIFIDSFEKLILLHNKYDFLRFAENLKIKTPNSVLVRNPSEVDFYLKESPDKKFVLKPIYSRFSCETQFIQYGKKYQFSIDRLYVLQEYLNGKEYCCYAIANHGKILAYSDYESAFTAGHGTTIAFKRCENECIHQIVSKIVDALSFHGQIGLDIIQTSPTNYYVIECNPRLTSGIQLLDGDIIKGKDIKNLNLSALKILMILLFPKWLFKIKKWLYIICNSKDSVFDKNDLRPFFMQIPILLYFCFLSLKNRVSLKKITTLDIEWNGK